MSKKCINRQNMKQYTTLIYVINTTKNGTLLYKTGRMVTMWPIDMPYFFPVQYILRPSCKHQ